MINNGKYDVANFNVNLYNLMTKNQVSVLMLAKYLGVSERSVYKYWTSSIPRIEIMELICAFFHTSIGYLFEKHEA